MGAGITPDEGRTRESEIADQIAGRATPRNVISVDTPFPSALDRVIPLGGLSLWQTLGWIAVFLVALTLRLMRLDSWALDADEAARAYDAWLLFRGQPPVSGETAALPNVGALLMLLEGAAFFLFGATDVVARIVPAVAGLALAALPLALRRSVGDAAALGMAALVALSPTLVYASRRVSPEIVIAALALGAVAVLVRMGTRNSERSARGEAITLGVIAGAGYAAGPSALTVIVTLAIGIAAAALAAPEGPIGRGMRQLRDRRTIVAFLLAAAGTAVLAFTRFFSHPGGIAGFGETLAAWWGLLTGSSGQPVQLFLLALLIYEPIAVVFAVVAFARDRDDGRDAVLLFAGWSVAAFAVWSFSAGREPGHAVHVALPLMLLAGIALGNALHAIDWNGFWRGSGGIVALAMLGAVVGVIAVGILYGRVNFDTVRSLMAQSPRDALAIVAPPIVVLCLIVVPLLYLIWYLHPVVDTSPENAGGTGQTALIALFVVALLLGAFGLRSATLLAFYRADLGTELIAQRTATLGTLPTIEGTLRLARDVGVDQGTARDPTGSHGLRIAVERDVRWPYVWYFREFPELVVVDPGAGAATGAQLVITAAGTDLTETGYSVDDWPWLNTVPPEYLNPDIGAIVSDIIDPRRWLDVWLYLLFRTGIDLPQPATVVAGYAPDLASRVIPATGPYDLDDRPLAGAEPGQFQDPIGVAVGPDGVIAVVDSGNARVQRFDADGDFLDIWGEDGDAGGVSFTLTENGLGPTGITVSPDQITWVADTWGHRVVGLDANGSIVQVIGGETVDIGDDPARVNEAGGRFFGPRSVAVSDAAIYVADTGNERVQQFTRDGAFVAAWGGYGTEPGQLIEPVGLALGPDGNIYVADSGNARISIFTPAGDPVAQWPVPDWPPPNPGGLPPAFQPYLAFDAVGNLYASASNAGQVLVFDREGTIIDRITEAGNEPLAQPIGVAIAPDGEVHITDVGRDAVLTYTPPQPMTAGDLDDEDSGSP